MPLTEIAIKTYTAIINQTGTAAPTAITLHNTFDGNITWERSTTGLYIATLPEEITSQNTATFITNQLNTTLLYSGVESEPYYIFISQIDLNTLSPTDDITNAIIEIRKY